jgi:hypothetical protein
MVQRYTYERADYVSAGLIAIFDGNGEGGYVHPIAYAKSGDEAKKIVEALNNANNGNNDDDDLAIYNLLFGEE